MTKKIVPPKRFAATQPKLAYGNVAAEMVAKDVFQITDLSREFADPLLLYEVEARALRDWFNKVLA